MLFGAVAVATLSGIVVLWPKLTFTRTDAPEDVTAEPR
jgi:hypothetical protein